MIVAGSLGLSKKNCDMFTIDFLHLMSKTSPAKCPRLQRLIRHVNTGQVWTSTLLARPPILCIAVVPSGQILVLHRQPTVGHPEK